MSTARRRVIGLVGLLVMLVAVPIVLVPYARWTAPTDAQRAAIALMAARAPEPAGENGYPMLMAFPTSSDSWPDSLQCRDAPSCIDRVAEHPAAHAAVLRKQSPLLKQAERALRAPVFRSPENALRLDARLPSFQWVIRLAPLRAQTYLGGDTAAALSDACQDAVDFGRWSRAADHLVQAMIAAEGLRQWSGMIADMRRRDPDTPLPSSCKPLLDAPAPASEGLVCEGIRGEWRSISSWNPMQPLGKYPAGAVRWAGPIHDPEQYAGRLAERFAGYCGPEAEADAVRDAIDRGRLDPPPRAIDLVAFPVTAWIVEDTGGLAYVDYWERQLDVLAMRRLLAAQLRIGVVGNAKEARSRFAALPVALRKAHRPLRLTDDGLAIAVRLRSERFTEDDDERVLPLAVSPR
jgi:hypothetical protein